MKERLSWDEIKRQYPDKWVGLSEVDWEDEANVRSAVVLGSSDTGSEFLSRQFRGEDVYTTYTTPNNFDPFFIPSVLFLGDELIEYLTGKNEKKGNDAVERESDLSKKLAQKAKMEMMETGAVKTICPKCKEIIKVKITGRYGEKVWIRCSCGFVKCAEYGI